MSCTTALVGAELTLAYGVTPVVRQASVELAYGQVTALVGPNGSGKSTLLRALARLHSVTSGQIRVEHGNAADAARAAETAAAANAASAAPGADEMAGPVGPVGPVGPAAPAPPGPLLPITELTPREFARRVALFSQSRPAPQGLSVEDVVGFGRYPYRRRFSGLTEADRAAIDSALAMTGISKLRGRAVGRLSGGELQRVWLAACLAQDTRVLLLDEPTNHLDLKYQVEVLELVRELAEDHGLAVGLVLHDLNQAALVADRVYLLQQGRIAAAGTPEEVFTAAMISQVYDLAVTVATDATTGSVRINARPRRLRRAPNRKSTA